MEGIDHHAQPRYPHRFRQADALEVLRQLDPGRYVAIHASPPCQPFSALRYTYTHSDRHPDLVAQTRDELQRIGLPYIIENVPGAPLRDPITLCGSMFGLGTECKDGIWREVRRHRLFELSWATLTPPCAHSAPAIGAYGTGTSTSRVGAPRGGYQGSVAERRAALEVPWMTISETSQAIPPAYTQFIGEQLQAQLALNVGPQILDLPASKK